MEYKSINDVQERIERLKEKRNYEGLTCVEENKLIKLRRMVL